MTVAELMVALDGVRMGTDVVVKTEFDLCNVLDAYLGKDDEGETVFVIVAKIEG